MATGGAVRTIVLGTNLQVGLFAAMRTTAVLPCLLKPGAIGFATLIPLPGGRS